MVSKIRPRFGAPLHAAPGDRCTSMSPSSYATGGYMHGFNHLTLLTDIFFSMLTCGVVTMFSLTMVVSSHVDALIRQSIV